MNGKLLAIVAIPLVVVMAAVLFGYAPSDSDDQTDIIILMGQSNAKYRDVSAIPGEAEPVPEPGKAWYYGTEAMPTTFFTPTADCGTWPMSDANGARIGDKWPSMAAAYTAATGRGVAMLYLAEGGISITTFDPMTGPIWAKCRPQAEAALESFKDAGLKLGRVNVVWIQGEADTSMPTDEYKARLLEVFEAVANGGLGTKVSTPIWICKVREARAPTIAEAQVEFCAEHPGLAKIATEIADTFTGNPELMYDYSHYTQKGNNILGEAVGGALAGGALDAAKSSSKLWLLIGVVPVVVIAALLVAMVSRN